jgi:hypothetical protein
VKGQVWWGVVWVEGVGRDRGVRHCVRNSLGCVGRFVGCGERVGCEERWCGVGGRREERGLAVWGGWRDGEGFSMLFV